MARYFFHIRDGSRLIPDEEGMELASIDAAWIEAHASADDLARQAVRAASSRGPWAVEVSDYAGVVFGTVKVPEQRQLA